MYKLITGDPNCIIASYVEDNHRACVECAVGVSFSLMERPDNEELLNIPTNKLANITRVLTSYELRGRGIATKLMDMVCEYADQNGIFLDLTINPYGDMTYEQLEDFYTKHGFKRFKSIPLYYRVPKGMIVSEL